MLRRRIIPRLAGVSLALAAAAAPLWADDGAPAPAERFVVKRTDLDLRVARDGRVDAAHRMRVKVGIAGYGGPLEVALVVRDRGPVREGEELLRLAAPKLEVEARAAREATDQARERLALLRAEGALLVESDKAQLERLERASGDAEQAALLFEKFQGPKMLRASELDVKGREQGVENARQELAQLERMYQGTQLATDTKEIVLERARRSLEMAEAYLELSRRDRVVTVESEHPRRARDVKDEARWAAQALARGRESIRLAEARKRAEVEAGEIALRGAEEQLAKLEADRERLVVKSPADGVLAPLDLARGDAVDGKAAIGTVLDASGLVVRFSASADDLRVLEGSREVTITFPERRELRVAGTLVELADSGSETKDGTAFPARVDLTSRPEGVRVGMRARVFATARRKGILAVPARAVREDGEVAYCLVAGDGGASEKRVLTVGASNGESIEVAAGLAEGDVVLLRAPEPKHDAPAQGAERQGVLAPPGAGSSSGATGSPSTVGLPPPGPAQTPAQALSRGVHFLLGAQNDDGSWGSFESARPDEIYLGTIASYAAFQVATSALCAAALERPAREDAAAREALRRAVRYLVGATATARATGDTFYDTWAHAYLLSTAARLSVSPAIPEMHPALRAVAEREVRLVAERQGADGGFAYYDFGYAEAVPTGHMSTSFLTAVTLLALRDARAAGIAVPQRVVDDGLTSLERQRLPSGAYIYGTYAEMRPNALFNWVKGSLGRSQPCNLALFESGRGLSRADLALGVHNLKEFHHFSEIGKGRPYPHEAWYYTAGYYFLFGHYYAARVLSVLDRAEQAEYAPWLASTMARLQDPDGSWFDFPLYGYHKEYGTAFGVLTLQEIEALPASGGEAER